MEYRILTMGRIILLILLVVGAGCTKARNCVYTAPRPEASLCRVAVLPLLNETEVGMASSLCYRTMVTELIAAPQIQVCNPADIKHILRRREIFPSDIYSAPGQVLEEIAQELHLDGYIRAKVLSFEMIRSGSMGEIPHVALQLELLQADGSLVSQMFCQRRGDDYIKVLHYGIIRTYTGLLVRMMEEIIAQWAEQGQIECGQAENT